MRPALCSRLLIVRAKATGLSVLAADAVGCACAARANTGAAAVETVPISNDLRSGPDCGAIVPE
jgi:hypothetical protein